MIIGALLVIVLVITQWISSRKTRVAHDFSGYRK